MRIALVSSTRADFGLQIALLQELQADPSVDLSFFVTGTHLEEHWGLTVQEILESRISITRRVKLECLANPIASSSAIFKEVVEQFNCIWARGNFDWVFLVGDRTEMLAIAITAFLRGFKIAHYSGGEVTVGSIDDQMRHCLTKLSSIHFVTAEEYRRRVIQLGELPSTVHLVSSLGLVGSQSKESLSVGDLERFVGLKFPENICLVAYHPETANPDFKESCLEFFRGLVCLVANNSDHLFIASYPNHDDQNSLIVENLKKLESTHSNFRLVYSFGHLRYRAMLKLAKCVIGNSSSGIYEAPTLGCRAINFGPRQTGRIKSNLIHDVLTAHEMLEAFGRFEKGLMSEDIQGYVRGLNTLEIIALLKDKLGCARKTEFFDIAFNLDNS